MFFASAMSNFGVELFLKQFIDFAARPGAAPTRSGAPVVPTSTQFTGLIFKLQANMDPKHRDKVAFVRVVSGEWWGSSGRTETCLAYINSQSLQMGLCRNESQHSCICQASLKKG